MCQTTHVGYDCYYLLSARYFGNYFLQEHPSAPFLIISNTNSCSSEFFIIFLSCWFPSIPMIATSVQTCYFISVFLTKSYALRCIFQTLWSLIWKSYMIISDRYPLTIKISFNVFHHLEYEIWTLPSGMKTGPFRAGVTLGHSWILRVFINV